eukprot:12933313-Prorocentrum_lima.AAC.1
MGRAMVGRERVRQRAWLQVCEKVDEARFAEFIVDVDDDLVLAPLVKQALAAVRSNVRRSGVARHAASEGVV